MTTTLKLEKVLSETETEKGSQGPKRDAAQVERYLKEIEAIENPPDLSRWGPRRTLCQAEIVTARGWDKALLDEVFPVPHNFVTNTRAPYGASRRKVRLYLASLVVEAEKSDPRVIARRAERKAHAWQRIQTLLEKPELADLKAQLTGEG